jgi:uncharacterized protein (DUF2336 family)
VKPAKFKVPFTISRDAARSGQAAPIGFSSGLFMIVRRFLQWAQTAKAGQRADGVRALAQAYINGDLGEGERQDAEIVLTAQLDDASPLVRRALAEALAAAPQAPRHLIAALAHDQSDIAAIVLNRSPHLCDAELIDAAAIGDAFVQSAVALRPDVSAGLAAALVEVGSREALICLAVNHGAKLSEAALGRMLERFGGDGELREALLARPGLPASLHNDLAEATATALASFVTQCQWLSPERAERVTKDARERATLAIAASSSNEDCLSLVRHLRAGGTLTAGLILRALLCGHATLFEAALADLAGMPLRRVIGLVRERRGVGFAALYRKAGLPKVLLPAFQAALAGIEEYGPLVASADGATLSQKLIERVLAACSHEGAETDKLFALLRRFEAEAARESARAHAKDMVREAHPNLVLEPADMRPAARQDLMGQAHAPLEVASPCDEPQAVDVPEHLPVWRNLNEEAISINVAALPVTFRGEAWLDRPAAPPQAASDHASIWIEPAAETVGKFQVIEAWSTFEEPAERGLDADLRPLEVPVIEASEQSLAQASLGLVSEEACDAEARAIVFEDIRGVSALDVIRAELGLNSPSDHHADDEFYHELQIFKRSLLQGDSDAFAVAA